MVEDQEHKGSKVSRDRNFLSQVIIDLVNLETNQDQKVVSNNATYWEEG